MPLRPASSVATRFSHIPPDLGARVDHAQEHRVEISRRNDVQVGADLGPLPKSCGICAFAMKSATASGCPVRADDRARRSISALRAAGVRLEVAEMACARARRARVVMTKMARATRLERSWDRPSWRQPPPAQPRRLRRLASRAKARARTSTVIPGNASRIAERLRRLDSASSAVRDAAGPPIASPTPAQECGDRLGRGDLAGTWNILKRRSCRSRSSWSTRIASSTAPPSLPAQGRPEPPSPGIRFASASSPKAGAVRPRVRPRTRYNRLACSGPGASSAARPGSRSFRPAAPRPGLSRSAIVL